MSSQSKKAYLILWRRKHKSHMQAYDKKRQPKNTARKRARRMMEKLYGKNALRGKDVHHKSGNPKDNSRKNLSVKKRYHGFSGKKGYK